MTKEFVLVADFTLISSLVSRCDVFDDQVPLGDLRGQLPKLHLKVGVLHPGQVPHGDEVVRAEAPPRDLCGGRMMFLIKLSCLNQTK